MSTFAPLLAHIGSPNNPWIGIMTIASAALLVIFVMLVLKKVTIAAPGDLLLPMAVVVLVAGLAGTLGDAINDQGPWAVPIGLVLLVALLVAAFRGGVDFGVTTRPTLITGLAAVVAAAALYVPLENLWFPGTQDVFLPERGDATVALSLVSAPDENGTFVVRLDLTGGTLGTSLTSTAPGDPETGMVTRFLVGPVYLSPPVSDACAADDACTESEYEITLPAGFLTEPPDSITVELLTANGLPFVEPLTASVSLAATS